MASFTDKTPTFNPYVSQQPVEDMVKVGMMKQQQYDTNLQKIQQSMSDIAGLQIARDVDKDYLQKKVDDVNSKLKVFAAGDFSNRNLTTSVRGMIGGIANDEVVQNAVASTQRYQNEMQVMSKEREDGNLTPDNQYHFQKQANKWFNDPTEGASFNGQYVKHFDVLKYTREVFDDIKPDGYQYDDLFSGVDKNGQPILSPGLKRMKKEGIMPEKVAQVVNQIFSDPRVNQQLQISGEYDYRGHSSEQLVEMLNFQEENTLNLLNEQLDDLAIKKQLGEDVQKQMDDINSRKQEMATTFDNYTSQAYQNPDAVRGKIYSDGQKLRYNRMFSNVKESTTYHTNPVWRGNFDIQKEANTQARHRDDMILKWANYNMNKEKNKNDYEISKAKIAADNIGAGNNFTSFQSQEDAEYSLENHQKADIMNKSQRFVASSNDLIWQGVFKDAHYDRLTRMIKEGVPQGEAINKILFEEARKNKKYVTIGEDGLEKINIEAFRTDYIGKVKSQLYNPETGHIDKKNPLLQKYYSYLKNKDNYIAAKEVKESIEQDFKEEMSTLDTTGGFAEIEPIEFGEGIGNISGVSLKPQDILDLEIIRQYGGGLNFSDNAKTKGEYSDIAIKRLQAKFGKDVVSGLRFLSGGRGYEPLITQMNKVKKAVKEIDFTSALKRKNDILKSVYTKKPNLALPVATGDLETDRGILERMRVMAETGEGVFDNVQNENENFKQFVIDINKDDTTLGKLALKYNIINTDDLQTKIIVKAGTSKDASAMTLNPEQARELGLNVDKLYEPDHITTLRQRINRSNATSFGNPSSISTYREGDAEFKHNFFTGMEASKEYNVQANIEKVGNQYVPHIYYQKFDENGKFLYDKIITETGDSNLALVVEKLRQKVTPYFFTLYD